MTQPVGHDDSARAEPAPALLKSIHQPHDVHATPSKLNASAIVPTVNVPSGNTPSGTAEVRAAASAARRNIRTRLAVNASRRRPARDTTDPHTVILHPSSSGLVRTLQHSSPEPGQGDNSVPLLKPASTHSARSAGIGVPSSETAADAIRHIVGDQDFAHWFQRRTRIRVSSDQLLIHVPNPFILNWLLKRFRSQLSAAAQTVLGPSASFLLEVDASLLKADESGASAGSVPSVADRASSENQIPSTSGSDSSGSAVNPFAQARKGQAVSPAGSALRRKFRTFATFINGDSNNLAALAARQVASAPGERFNPLYIYGGTGTGKTHLLEGIYSEVRRSRPHAQVMYLTTESFTNYFTSALSSRTVPSFRQRFRNVDVLLIDNVEFLDNKRATQEEFLHTIVQVTEHGGQVVVSSDRHPRMLTKHREELTTRFMGGLVCRIENPDEETCLSIARSTAMNLTAQFSDDVLQYVARRCRKNIREIQGALNSLDGQYSLNGRRITLATAREVLGELTQECHRLVRISDVERVVCEAFGVSTSDLRSSTRRKAISLPRSIAMFISRRMTKSAYREIGLYFGGRDHSTVVAAERRIAELISSEAAMPLPSSCTGKSVPDVIEELQARLIAMAS
ncbi:MAG: chromosomal replication initiator protein DnaA [Planctomycetaceae bacterium]